MAPMKSALAASMLVAIVLILNSNVAQSKHLGLRNLQQQQQQQQFKNVENSYNSDNEIIPTLDVRFAKDKQQEKSDQQLMMHKKIKKSTRLNRRSLAQMKRQDRLGRLEFCHMVNCANVHSNGQVSKTWRILQLASCCPSFRVKHNIYRLNK